VKNPLIEDDNTGAEGNPRTMHHVSNPRYTTHALISSHFIRDIDRWMQSRGGFGSSSGRRALVGGWKFGGFVRHDEFSTELNNNKKNKIGRKIKRRLRQPEEAEEV
jgi:hypothetical protein